MDSGDSDGPGRSQSSIFLFFKWVRTARTISTTAVHCATVQWSRYLGLSLMNSIKNLVKPKPMTPIRNNHPWYLFWYFKLEKTKNSINPFKARYNWVECLGKSPA